ncbi:MAG: Gfo/Idh/MocA family oxidoreductase [Anaerolineaceae bacterium]|nr:Gfo/Idh/MocA family oxidoreductase [Anaerolineaceae bacterium]
MQAAIIGCGFIAGVHAQALKELGHKIVTVVDHNLPKAEAFAKQWNVQDFSDDYRQALRDDIDCIHICTPPAAHYQIIKDVLNTGIHVICEKPMCLDPEKALELFQLSKEKKRIAAVNFNVRFHDACGIAKNTIASTEFGKICLIHGSYLQEFHVLPNAYDWRYSTDLAGPMRATTEIGSHWIDLVRYWTGLEIDEVSANFGKFTPKRYLVDGMMFPEQKPDGAELTVDSEDAAVISIRFSNGAIGNLLLSEVSHGRMNRLSLEVTSPSHSIWWNSEEPYYLKQSQKSSGVITQTNAFSGGFPDTFHTFFSKVYQDIEAGYPAEQPDYPTFFDGCVNAAVCAAIYESANNNSTWVSITLD